MDELGILDHLATFYGDSVEQSELRNLALAAVASSIRQLKLAIAERVWQARLLAGAEGNESQVALADAKVLRERYLLALREHESLSAPDESANRTETACQRPVGADVAV